MRKRMPLLGAAVASPASAIVARQTFIRMYRCVNSDSKARSGLQSARRQHAARDADPNEATFPNLCGRLVCVQFYRVLPPPVSLPTISLSSKAKVDGRRCKFVVDLHSQVKLLLRRSKGPKSTQK